LERLRLTGFFYLYRICCLESTKNYDDAFEENSKHVVHGAGWKDTFSTLALCE
jgi:hypothetical protein